MSSTSAPARTASDALSSPPWPPPTTTTRLPAIGLVVLERGGERHPVSDGLSERRRRKRERDRPDRDDDLAHIELVPRGSGQPIAVGAPLEGCHIRWVALRGRRSAGTSRRSAGTSGAESAPHAPLPPPAPSGRCCRGCRARTARSPSSPTEGACTAASACATSPSARRTSAHASPGQVRCDGEPVRARPDDRDVEALRQAGRAARKAASGGPEMEEEAAMTPGARKDSPSPSPPRRPRPAGPGRPARDRAVPPLPRQGHRDPRPLRGLVSHARAGASTRAAFGFCSTTGCRTRATSSQYIRGVFASRWTTSRQPDTRFSTSSRSPICWRPAKRPSAPLGSTSTTAISTWPSMPSRCSPSTDSGPPFSSRRA